MEQRPLEGPSSTRITLRWFAVVLLCIVSIGSPLPSITRLWAPLADPGFSATEDGAITGVNANSPASRAGMKPGDRIDLHHTPFEDRFALQGVPSPWRVYHLAVVHGGSERILRIVPVAESLSLSTKIGLATRTAVAVIMPISGAILLLMRPSLMTWALFIFLAGAGPGSDGGFWALLSFAGKQVSLLGLNMLYAAGLVGAMAFMILFPTNAPISRWSAALLKAAPWILGVLVAMQIYVFWAEFSIWPTDAAARVFQIAMILCLFAGTAAFLERYVQAEGHDRAGIRWVGTALAIGIGGFLVAAVSEVALPGLIAYGPRSYLYSMAVLVPFAVFYAVLKHHVIDVRFFIGRAIVYTALTGGMVLVFSLLDWFFSKRFADSGVGTGVDVLVAIGLGFSLNSVHAKLDSFVERVFFRQRHDAELRLQRAAHTIPHANTVAAVHQLLVVTPCEALHLESGALFHRADDGAFGRKFALGWQDETSAAIAADDVLALHLESGREPLRLRDIAWNAPGLPPGAARPVIAFPVFLRNRLEAFVLFGPHANGADIDPDEERCLTELAVNAGAAYDHIDAERVRAEMERMRLEYNALRLEASL